MIFSLKQRQKPNPLRRPVLQALLQGPMSVRQIAKLKGWKIDLVMNAMRRLKNDMNIRTPKDSLNLDSPCTITIGGRKELQ